VAFVVLLVVVYVLVCLFLILVVLLQQGKGADLAGAFGGGGSQTSFGPRSGTNIMHKLTTASFVLFVVLSIALAIISGKGHGRSAMDNVSTAPPVEAPAAGTEEGGEVAVGPVSEEGAEEAAAGAVEAGPEAAPGEGSEAAGGTPEEQPPSD
jgi:preprotein translocase subunit SecG